METEARGGPSPSLTAVAETIQETCRSVPWNRGQWSGSWLALDGTEAGPFEAKDVEKVLFMGAYGTDDWDGKCACILRLRDGRFVAYESWWGPTGSGFSEDAYGGDACVHFASTLEKAAMLGLTKEAREICGYEKGGG